MQRPLRLYFKNLTLRAPGRYGKSALDDAVNSGHKSVRTQLEAAIACKPAQFSPWYRREECQRQFASPSGPTGGISSLQVPSRFPWLPMLCACTG